MSTSQDELVFRPVGSNGSFIYMLPDGRRLARDVMERLADSGMLRRLFSDRINVCPKCGSANVLFREVCPHCQSPEIEQPEAIHHFLCAGVFRTELFGDAENLTCPKCRKKLKHVGVDHEYIEAEFACQSCGRSASVVPTFGRCLECDNQFPSEESAFDDWYDYIPTERWDMKILGDAPSQQEETLNPRVLIVDDIEDNLTLLEDILIDLNLTALRASSGAEALSIAENELFDLVILDVNMPEMDGFEVARAMRATKQCKSVPIIFLTAYRTADNDLVTGLGAGANDYVTKPFDEDDLVARVEAMLRRGNAARR